MGHQTLVRPSEVWMHCWIMEKFFGKLPFENF